MIDAHAEEIGPVLLHVVNGRIDVAWTHVAAAKAGRGAVHARNAVDSLLAVLSIDRIAEGSLDLAGQVIARGRQWVVHAFEDSKCLAILEGRDNLPGRERPEDEDVQAAGGDPLDIAQIINGCFGRFHVRAHTDQNVFGVLAAIGFQEIIAPAGLAVELGKRIFEGRLNAVVVPTLGDFSLHVRVLILHHAGHHGVIGIHQVSKLFLRVADVFLHKFRLGQADRFDRVRGKEAVLHIEERRLRRLGGSARDQAKVAGFLCIAAEDHSPAAIGHAHQIIVAGVHV